ncbi:MAG: GHKL domain-containing protein [Bdellovibrionaceae bacterium]|nr:GHKL domain-containing protein [Pseudobdellovibrionaceae bacterium]
MKSSKEQGKRRKETFIIFALCFLFLILAWFEFRVFNVSRELPFEYSIFFFGLVNFNLILLLLLFFLIFRNLFKAFIEKRKGLVGSSLRSRLVMTFFVFSAVPTVLMFFVSVIYINSSFDKWFNEKITDVMKSALEVTTHFYMDQKKGNFFAAHMIAQKLRNANTPQEVQAILKQEQQIYGLDAVEYYSDLLEGRTLVMSSDQTIPEVPRATVEFLERGLEDKSEASTVHQHTKGNLVRAMVPIKGKKGVVIVSSYVPLALLQKMDTIGSIYEDLKGNGNPIQLPLKSIYLVVLLLMALVILFCATWFGFYMAKHLSEALSILGQATRRIALGDYRPVELSNAETEVLELAENFNSMANRLETSRKELNDANDNLHEILHRLDERTRYIEVVLSNVSTGVISLDEQDRITTINDRAATLFHTKTTDYLGSHLKDVIGEKYYRLYRQMVLNMGQYSLMKMTRQLQIEIHDASFPCLFTISRLTDEVGNDHGTVIGFDDLTDVFNSQKIEAWKEVARRIAHEIKNPLTPIKLSAQRLQRKFSTSISDEAFKACTDMIIQQADEMKRLVNEFSEYARLPQLEKNQNNINELIKNVSAIYGEGYKNVEFKTLLDEELQPFLFDNDQIKRVLINLVENALAALAGVEKPYISFTTRADSLRQTVCIIVADNGSGISDGNFAKLFEPYYSTKPTGSGLGLAIVNKIIQDHGGIIQAYATDGGGLSFKIDLPYSTAEKTVNV